MDFSYYKYLTYISKNGFTTKDDLKRVFHLCSDDVNEILNTLKENGYIIVLQDYMYYSTYKGKTFLPSALFSWIIQNFLSIIAIIISIIALFK